MQRFLLSSPVLVALCVSLGAPLLMGGLVGSLVGCSEAGSASAPPLTAEEGPQGEEIEPPFAVRGDGEGLMLVWFDGEGAHTASRREDIPEAHRDRVRVDSLRLAPEERDPDHVYVADMRDEVEGRYPVRRFPREAFDQMVERASAAARPGPDPANAAAGAIAGAGGGAGGIGRGALAGGSDVVIYGASWCSACRATASFLRERQVPFVERDIEREPGARAEMLRRAQSAGIQPTGIPVIDFRGQIITGFNRSALEQAIRASQVQI